MKTETLKKTLIREDYSIIAYREDMEYHSKAGGIFPVISKLEDRDFFKDCIVVDKVVGKASAMLLIRSGVKRVHGLLVSESAVKITNEYNIPFTYDEVVPYIINRTGDDMCPMEKTVKDIEDLDEAYAALLNKVKELRNAK